MSIRIGEAGPADLAVLEAIENCADTVLVAHLRPSEPSDPWPAAPDINERCHEPGFILAARSDDLPDDAPPVGFAHVIEHDDGAHLEQLAVLPEYGRRGIGAKILDAAVAESRARGQHRMTLRTFAEVPFNAPFYARHGFKESTPDTDFLRDLVDLEEMLGLPAWGRRVQMERPL